MANLRPVLFLTVIITPTPAVTSPRPGNVKRRPVLRPFRTMASFHVFNQNPKSDGSSNFGVKAGGTNRSSGGINPPLRAFVGHAIEPSSDETNPVGELKNPTKTGTGIFSFMCAPMGTSVPPSRVTVEAGCVVLMTVQAGM